MSFFLPHVPTPRFRDVSSTACSWVKASQSATKNSTPTTGGVAPTTGRPTRGAGCRNPSLAQVSKLCPCEPAFIHLFQLSSSSGIDFRRRSSLEYPSVRVRLDSNMSIHEQTPDEACSDKHFLALTSDGVVHSCGSHGLRSRVAC